MITGFISISHHFGITPKLTLFIYKININRNGLIMYIAYNDENKNMKMTKDILNL